MIYEIKLAVFLVFVLLIGVSLFFILTQDKPCISIAEKIALSFGLGIGSLALGMFYLSIIGIELNLFNVVLLFTPLVVFSFIILKDSLKHVYTHNYTPNLKMNYTIKEYIILIILIYISALVFLDAVDQPLNRWDDRAFWGLKAKILYHDSTIYSTDFFDTARIHWHKQYPLLIPLVESMIYISLGTIDDSRVKFIFPILFILLLVVFYYAQSRFLPRMHSLCFTALLATLPFILVTSLPFPDSGTGPSSGYSDIPLAFFYFVASIYMYLWFVNPQKNGYIALSAAFLVFVIFTKSEGFFLYLINLFIFFTYIALNYKNTGVKKAMRNTCALLSPLIFLLPWFIFQTNLPNDFEIKLGIAVLLDHIDRLPSIIRFFSFNYLHPLHWSLVFPLFIMSALLTLKGTIKDHRIYLYVLILMNITSLVILYLLSPIKPIELHLNTSFDRMTMHFMPIVIFLLSMNLWLYKKNMTAHQ